MAPSAGWYDNPDNPAQLRWWDGAEWTEHVHPKPSPVDIYAPAPRTAPSTETQSRAGVAKFVRPRNIVIAASAALVIFVAGGAVAAGNARSALTQDVSAIAEAVTPSPTPPPSPKEPKETHRMLSETEAVPFSRVNVDDPNRNFGTSAVTQAGVNGVRTKTYRVTLRDGVEVNRVLVTDEVTTQAVDEVTAVGTYVAPPPPPAPVAQAPVEPAPAPGGGCDPNYAGQCVPVASDVDCGGGSGNGPAYVWGPVRIVGSDIYDLDRDGDGIACDN